MEINMMSEKINELVEALSKAQGEFPVLEKKSKAYNYMYADLAETLQAIQPIMSKYGLSIAHCIQEGEHSKMVSKLFHSSGQWISTEMLLEYRADGKVNAMQAKGSAITYAKRYTIGCLLNLAADKESDDDGAKSSPKDSHQSKVRPLSNEQIKDIAGWIKTFPESEEYLCKRYLVDSITSIPEECYESIISMFKKKYAKMKQEENNANTP
jgi:hypothetical protein